MEMLLSSPYVVDLIENVEIATIRAASSPRWRVIFGKRDWG
jgi:hypothetical protein